MVAHIHSDIPFSSFDVARPSKAVENSKRWIFDTLRGSVSCAETARKQFSFVL